jgi:molybdopterin converting factor small subunit
VNVPMIFHIPGPLREFTAGHSEVKIEHSPATLAEALSALWTVYPGVRDRIVTEQGQVREHINIFIADENIRYTGGLASPVSTESEISIVPAISGGRAS